MYQPKQPNNAAAAALIATATAFIAATTLMAKALGDDVLGPALHPFQISHGRFLFAFVTFGLSAVILRPSMSAPHWGLHATRTILGWGGVTLMFTSVAYIPLADATAISFLNPVFAMVLAIPLLGERVGPARWSAAVIALIGALILLRPTPNSFQPAALFALTAAVAMGLELIFIKKLSGREPIFQILLVNNLIGLGIATVAVLPVWTPPTPLQWAALAGLGMLMACAQTCFLQAMRNADASFTLPFSYATLVFAALYDAWIFGVIPDGVSVVGAVVIVAGAAVLAWREGRAQGPRVSAGTRS